jgi:hypothetical protein
MGSERSDRRPWPYSVGTRGVNCVRVYNRDDCGDSIQIEWSDDRGRIQRALTSIVGVPVTDRTLARDIADRLSAAQAQKRNAHARALVFGADAITLGALLEKYHDLREGKWSPNFVKDQRRYRAFWLQHLGAETPVHPAHINEAKVTQIVDREATLARRPWGGGTKGHYLGYIRDALRYGKEQLKVLDDKVLLTALELPSKGRGVSYTAEEIALLLTDLRERDLRAFIVATAYHQAGRRINATRLLAASDVRFATFPTPSGKHPAAVLTYAAGTDKAGKAGEAVLAGAAVDALRELLAKPAVKATGWLMPVGDLDDGAVRVGRQKRGPISKDTLYDILADAEEAVGIAHVKGRLYHGMKRRFATLTKAERAIAARQSGTTEATLAGIYEQDDDLPGKFELATMLVEALPAPKLKVVR